MPLACLFRPAEARAAEEQAVAPGQRVAVPGRRVALNRVVHNREAINRVKLAAANLAGLTAEITPRAPRSQANTKKGTITPAPTRAVIQAPVPRGQGHPVMEVARPRNKNIAQVRTAANLLQDHA